MFVLPSPAPVALASTSGSSGGGAPKVELKVVPDATYGARWRVWVGGKPTDVAGVAQLRETTFFWRRTRGGKIYGNRSTGT